VKALNLTRSDSNDVPENDSVSAQSSDPSDKKPAHSFFDEGTPDTDKSCEVNVGVTQDDSGNPEYSDSENLKTDAPVICWI